MYGTERRNNKDSNEQRQRRLRVGGISAPISAPLAILLVYVFQEVSNMTLPEYIVVASAAVVGSITTGASLCFHDLRAVILQAVMRRRSTDKRRRK